MLLAEIISNNSAYQKNKKCSLQVHNKKSRSVNKNGWLKASCPASCSASFTVEAALVLPAMLFVLCAFLYFLIILTIQVEFNQELMNQARKVSRYAFAYEEVLHMSPAEEQEYKKGQEPGLTDVLFHGFSSAYALGQIKKEIGVEWLDRSCIKGGADGLSFLSDSLISDNHMVDMVLRYQVKIPYLPGDIFSLLCVQRVRIRTFTGFMPPGEEGTEKEEAEALVYVTETGSVYHTSKYCTHLNLSIKAVDCANLASMRNSSGGIYYACERCGGVSEGSNTVYVTTYGDRYHGSTDCQGLKRSFQEIPISEVEGRRQCKKCQKQEQKGGG